MNSYHCDLHNGQKVWAQRFTGTVMNVDGATANSQEQKNADRDAAHEGFNIRLAGTDGTERAVFSEYDIDVSIGDTITITWGNIEGSNDGPFWHIDNHTRNRSRSFIDGAPFRPGWRAPKFPRGYTAYLIASTVFLYLLAAYRESQAVSLDWILWLFIFLAVRTVERRRFVQRCEREIHHFFRRILAYRDIGRYQADYRP